MYEPESVYYISDQGLKIFPTPKDAPVEIHYKWLIKRKWWEFWKPKWIFLSTPFEQPSNKSEVKK